MEPLKENTPIQSDEIINDTISSLKNVLIDNDGGIQSHPQHWCGQNFSITDSFTNVYNYSNEEEREKSPMCRVAEIARFNKLRHTYDLLDESGPAHKKLFTVRLNLKEGEGFYGSGSSIKRAQQAAAENALKNTKLPVPANKLLRKKKNAKANPVKILQNVCRTLLLPKPLFTVLSNAGTHPNFQTQMIPLNQNFTNVPQLPFNQNIPNFVEQVAVSIPPFPTVQGIGKTVSEAKSDAAIQALRFLEPNIRKHHEKMSMELKNNRYNDENEIPKYKQRSVISQVHEKAIQLKVNVIFEVLQEEGPPHNREYIVKCAFVNKEKQVTAQATGKGRKKKEAQQEACQELLKVLLYGGIDSSPVLIADSLCRTQKKLTVATKEPKRRTIVKDKKMDPDYGHQINPVSRLIQVYQIKQQDRPIFELVGEHGHSRYKEFVIRVTCGNDSCEGRGPNKRLAKRSAAEEMLALIGYIKPLPPPGKSLLKKKSIDITPESIACSIQSPEQNIDERSVEFSSKMSENGSDSHNADCDSTDSPESGKRRVTFNSQVEACPPPGDQNYLIPMTAPLKKEVVVDEKVRRPKKTKEKRILNEEEKIKLAELAKNALDLLEEQKNGEDNGVTARQQLDQLAAEFKFYVNYIGLPQGEGDHFILLTTTLQIPLVCHGVGATQAEADERAAIQALQNIKNFENKSGEEEGKSKDQTPQMSPVEKM